MSDIGTTTHVDEKSKTVLYLSPLPPPAGGIATWTEKLLRAGLPGGYKPYFVDTSIRGERPVFGKASFGMVEIYRTARIIWLLSASLLVRRISVAHINCSLSPTGIFREFVCALLIRLRRVPLVTHYHGNMPNFPLSDYPKDKYAGLSLWALRSLVRLSSRNIVLNLPSLEFCKQLENTRQPSCCVLLPNFIEDSVVNSVLPNRDREPRRTQAMFVGGLTKEKGVFRIIEIARRVPMVDFVLIGHILPSVAPELSNLPDNVTITGPVRHEKVMRMVASGDMFLFPSAWGEGFPFVVLEAMSLGLPVVTSDVGALPEMIENGRGGFVFDFEDIDGMENAIRKLVNDEALRKRQGEFNRLKSRRDYVYSVVSEKLTSIYDHVVSQ